MNQAIFGIPRLVGRRSWGFSLWGVFVLAASTGYASDIGGEVAPPPCSYDSSGAIVVGPPQCGGLTGVSVVSHTGSVLGTLPFSAPAAGGTVDHPFQWTDTVSGGASDLFLTGTLGPFLPLSADPQLEGNALGGRQFFSRMISETLVNDSQTTWTGIYIELRTDLNIPSSNSDGLSFGQISRDPNGQQLVVMPSAVGFSMVTLESNLHDSITFTGGSIAPHQSVTLSFPVSETLAFPGFYLLQSPIQATPEPATFLFSLTALALLVYRRRAAAGGGDPETSAQPVIARISARR